MSASNALDQIHRSRLEALRPFAITAALPASSPSLPTIRTAASESPGAALSPAAAATAATPTAAIHPPTFIASPSAAFAITAAPNPSLASLLS